MKTKPQAGSLFDGCALGFLGWGLIALMVIILVLQSKRH